jgi:predicted dienelactone hydrolase
VPIRVWYPAAAPGSEPAAVFTPAEQAVWEQGVALPAGALDGVGAAATAAAPAAGGSHPVLLLSPGLGETTGLMSNHAGDLASHGYVVVGIDVPGETEALDLGDGKLVAKSPGLARASARTIALRSRDMRFVLGELGTLRGVGRLDRHRVGAFGHSNGGATAAATMLADRRLRAGVNLDGGIFGPVVDRGLDRPFAVLQGEGPFAAYATLREFRSHLRGPHPYLQVAGAAHHSFTDNVWLVPQLGLDPADSDVGSVDPARTVPEQNTFLLRFFDRYVGATRG